MRQRKAKDLDRRLQECSDFIKPVPEAGNWDEVFGNPGAGGAAGEEDLYLEIGCGKGQFIIKKAADNPHSRYIAIEGQETVILRAAEKAKAVAGRMPWPENVSGEERLEDLMKNMAASEEPLNNLVFISCFVEKMNDLFRENQLAGVYLNFSDPWPKARHKRRRLTCRQRLKDYAWAIRPGGFIEIKTDNEGLFEFTLEEIEACRDEGIRQIEMTRDLHGAGNVKDVFRENADRYESAETTTEYEDRFSGRGKNINYVKVIINK